ncbi:MAG: hypothetical protein OXE42_02140 [Gammaproteobacteria bacterium]|nr:hypothetical protein [Gammaproteobacteria bacterium]
MGIMNTDRTLPSNRMVFEVRRSPEMYERFTRDLEQIMAVYGLSEEEKAAWREENIGQLAELGVHPYFLPQISRLFHGVAHNHNESEACKAYARHLDDLH